MGGIFAKQEAPEPTPPKSLPHLKPLASALDGSLFAYGDDMHAQGPQGGATLVAVRSSAVACSSTTASRRAHIVCMAMLDIASAPALAPTAAAPVVPEAALAAMPAGATRRKCRSPFAATSRLNDALTTVFRANFHSIAIDEESWHLEL